MNNKFANKEYIRAAKNILKKNAVLEKPDHEITYEEAMENFRRKLKEVSEQIINGEFDDEIEEEIELMKEER